MKLFLKFSIIAAFILFLPSCADALVCRGLPEFTPEGTYVGGEACYNGRDGRHDCVRPVFNTCDCEVGKVATCSWLGWEQCILSNEFTTSIKCDKGRKCKCVEPEPANNYLICQNQSCQIDSTGTATENMCGSDADCIDPGPTPDPENPDPGTDPGSGPGTGPTPEPTPATVNMSALNENLSNNTGTTVYWNYSNANSCTATFPSFPGFDATDGADSGSFETGNLIGPGSYSYSLTCWGSNGLPINDNVSINVSSPPTPFSLKVEKSGQGLVFSTLVDPSQPGINCGGACISDYLPDTKITLFARPNPGRKFAGWSGDCTGLGLCNLIMNDAKNVKANFIVDPNYKEF